MNAATPKPSFGSVTHALFQARMWRKDAMAWDLPEWHERRRFVEHILKIDRSECLRRAMVAVEAAKRLNAEAAK